MANKKKFVLILNEIKVQGKKGFFSISVPSILTYQEIIFYRTLPLRQISTRRFRRRIRSRENGVRDEFA